MARPQSNAWLMTLVTNAVILVCGVFTGIVAARLLHPEGRGALATILFWPAVMATIGMCGLNEALVYQVSAGKKPTSGLLTPVICTLGLAVLTAICGLLLLPSLLGKTGGSWIHDGSLYMAWFVPLNLLSQILLAVDQGHLRFARYNLLRMLIPLAYAAGLFGLWVLHRVNVENVLWVNLAATAGATTIRVAASWRELRGGFAWAEARELFATGLGFHATGLLVLLSGQIDRALVMALWDSATVGLYAAAFTYSGSALSVITTTVHTVVFPRIANLQDEANRRALLGRTLRFSMLIICLCTVPMVLLTSWAVPRLFGADFSAAVVPSMVLLAAYVPLAMRQIIVRAVRGFGDARLGVIAESIAVIVFLIGAYPLGRSFGLTGIALALLLGNSVCFVYAVGYLRRTFGIQIRDWWGIDVGTLRDAVKYVHGILPNRTTPLIVKAQR
jgi:O-antigen/teichoic acid export membrane protein